MLQVRTNVFETNSSSSHSLVIGKRNVGKYTPEEAENELYSYHNGVFEPWHEDFYFGRTPFQVLHTFTDKLLYAYASCPYRSEESSKRDYSEVDKIVAKFIPGFKHVKFDRGAYLGTEDCMLWKWLEKADISLIDFLISKNIVVICDGDEYNIWSDLKDQGLVNLSNIEKEFFTE